MNEAIEQAEADPDTAFDLGRIAGYDEAMRERVQGPKNSTQNSVDINVLKNEIWRTSTQDFGGYSARDALAVAHALLGRFTITEKEEA